MSKTNNNQLGDFYRVIGSSIMLGVMLLMFNLVGLFKISKEVIAASVLFMTLGGSIGLVIGSAGGGSRDSPAQIQYQPQQQMAYMPQQSQIQYQPQQQQQQQMPYQPQM